MRPFDHLCAAARCAPSPDLEAAWGDCLARAAAERPGLRLDAGAFAAAVGERLRPDEPPESQLRALHAGDLLLALLAAAHDGPALALFEREVAARIPALLAPHAALAPLGEQIAQDVRAALLLAGPDGRPRLLGYSGRSPLLAWVRVVAVRQGLRARRAEQRRARHEEAAPEPLPALDPERDLMRLQFRAAFDRACRAALAALPARERLLLKLRHQDGLSIDKLAVVYGQHRATAARQLAQARRALLDGTRARLREALGLGEAELEEALRSARSQLSVSLRSSATPDAP